MTFELYYYDTCPFCRYVFQTIERLQISDKIVFKNIYADPAHRHALMKMNGHRQVPCLVIDGQPMLESAAIRDFLSKKFGAS